MKKVVRIIKWICRAIGFAFIALLIFISTLFFREQKIPKTLIDSVSEKCSTSNIIIRCDNASFGFRRGLFTSGIFVYDKTRVDPLTPVVSISSLSIDPFRRIVHLVEPKFLRLHDAYYEAGGYQERNSRLELELPQLPSFDLIVDRPNILGLTPRRVTGIVNSSKDCLNINSIRLDWPNESHQMELNGFYRIDLERQRAYGEVRGLSTVPQIRPLLVALDIEAALPYMDAFTEITSPVTASGTFDVNLMNNDFLMRLDLHPTMGKYNGVPLVKAEGILGLYVFTRGTNCNVKLDLNLSKAIDSEGKNLSGDLTMNMSNNLVRLSYDVKSELAFRDTLEIADFIKPETLDIVTCDTKPIITIKGRSGVSVKDLNYNNLNFNAKLEKGAFLGLQLRDLDTSFSIVGEELNFSKIDAKGKSGGVYNGTAKIKIPNYDENKMTFNVKLDCKDGALDELADVAKFDLGEHRGTINGHIELDGPVATNFMSNLNGSGLIKITEGHLAQMKLFAGLTKLLAEKVPGVNYIVNQTDASANFTISNGVIHSDDVYIEGGLISIKAWGSYDVPKDNLDFTVRVQLLKNETLLGKLLHQITFPFTKLLLEFKATGSLDSPKWDYISLLDRVL